MRFRGVKFVPFAILLAIWSLLTYGGVVDSVFLPTPSDTAVAFVKLLSAGFFVEHLLPSLGRVAVAYLISVLIAFPLGVVSGQFLAVAGVVHPLCAFTRYLPVAALVPMCILWFGIGHSQKIAVIAMGVVFQLVLLLAYDSASVPKELIEAGRTFGLSPPQILRRIVVPAALPAIWDHLRISAGWAWSYLVLAELVAGNQGLGYFVVQSQRFLNTDRVFAGILLIGALGGLTDFLFRIAARRMFRWT